MWQLSVWSVIGGAASTVVNSFMGTLPHPLMGAWPDSKKRLFRRRKALWPVWLKGEKRLAFNEEVWYANDYTSKWTNEYISRARMVAMKLSDEAEELV